MEKSIDISKYYLNYRHFDYYKSAAIRTVVITNRNWMVGRMDKEVYAITLNFCKN